MPAIEKNSLADQVYTMLKEKILSGELTGGMKIPEESLAAEFGVSRTPIREAVRRLAEYGLVDVIPRSHAVVKKIGAKESHDIAIVRITLESLAIDTITSSSLSAHIKEISRYAAECQYAMSIGERATVFEQDSLFHLALVKASENDALYNICSRLDAQIQQLRIAQNLPNDQLAPYIAEHTRLMDLLREGKKEECKALLSEHILHDGSLGKQ